jgi:hypothetical protein
MFDVFWVFFARVMKHVLIMILYGHIDIVICTLAIIKIDTSVISVY